MAIFVEMPDYPRAAALLEEAFAQAAQAEGGARARGAVAVMTATAAMRLDSPRAWEALAAAVASLNEDDEFTGDPVAFKLEAGEDFGPGVAEALDYALGQFDLEDLFDAAGQKSFDRAAAEARNLKGPAARARALVATARAELVRARLATGYLRPSR
jgi:hypothetical protein